MRGGLGGGVWAELIARRGARRGPWFAALLLGMCLAPWALGVTRADAAIGELSFLGCLGQLSGCTTIPAGLTGAVENPKGLVVSPDGVNVYAADEGSSAVDVFSRNSLTGTLTLTGCVGQHSGCTATTPEKAVERPFSVAVSQDGTSVYAASVGSNAVDEFSRDAGTGALTFIGCVGQLAGCTPTSPADAVSAPISVVVSTDGSSVYVAANGGAVDEFQRNTITGVLTFHGCIGAEVAGCTVPSKPNSMHALGDVVISPDGTSVYAGGETGSISTFTRNSTTGALAFADCIGYLPECTQTSVHFAVNEPLSLAISPDGANLYAGNFNNGLVDVFTREAGTGTLKFTGCNGYDAEEPAACTAPPKGVPEGPLQIAISPDGADLYVASDYSVSEFSRGPGGVLSYVGCTGQVPGICTATNPSEAVFFQISLALSPNGANLYSGDQLAHDVDEFGRMTPPPTSTPVTVGQPPATPPSNQPSTEPSTAIASSVASTPQAIEELELGCSGARLVLNDVYIHGSRVAIAGSAAKSLVGKKVKILFNEGKQVATATVEANGKYATTAPLPPAKIRDNLDTRYTAEIGKLRSLHLKLVRRLLLEPPKASGTAVTLTGQLTPPLTKPIAPVTVEQQLECGKTTIAKTFTPSANGRFDITLTVPANAKAAIFRLTSKVAANTHSITHGFTTFSLPLPVVLG
jgi:DNA-binding beta-propeller fold protein YncE